MVLPPVSAVKRKFRGAAYCIVFLGGVGIAAWFCNNLLAIINNAESPPTEFSILTGYEDHGLAWGPLPSIILETVSWMGTLRPDAGGIYDPYATDWQKRFKVVPEAEEADDWMSKLTEIVKTNVLQLEDYSAKQIKNVSGPRDPDGSSVKVRGRYAIINASMLTPYFKDQYDHTKPSKPFWTEKPRLRAVVRYTSAPKKWNWEQAHGMNLGLVDPSTKIDWSKLSALNSKFQAQLQNPPHKVSWFKFTLQKVIRPRSGIYWGWPGEDDHTQTEYKVRRNGVTQWDSSRYLLDGNDNAVMLEFFIDSSITVTKPISVLTQIGALLSGVGGWLAFLSTVFALVFVSTRKPPPEPEIKDELTLAMTERMDHTYQGVPGTA